MGTDFVRRQQWGVCARRLAATASLMALAACGGGGSGGSAEPPAAAASSPAASLSGPDGATLRLPEGALALPAPTVRIAKDASAAPPLPAALAPAGDVFAVTPGDVALQVIGTLRIPVDPNTPDGTPVAIAETNDSGGWTLRADTRIDGAMLEVSVSRLGHFRAVRPPADAPKAAAPGRKTAQKYDIWTFGIAVAAPGFAPVDLPDGAGGTVAVLQPASPFAAIGTVAATAQPVGSRPGFCADATSIDIDYVTSGTYNFPAGSVRQAIAPGRTSPWAFDLRIVKPVDLPFRTMFAAVTVNCGDASGGTFAVRAARTLRYELDFSIGGLELSAPGFTATGTLPSARQLRGNAPYPSPTSVPLTVSLATPPGEAARCVKASSITLEYFGASTGSRFIPHYVLDAPIPTPGAAPWAIDMRLFRPVPDRSATWARATVHCIDEAGAPLAYTADPYINFSVSIGSDPAFFSHPADATAVVGQAATFEVRVSGGPVGPGEFDRYSLAWEQSRDAGTSWQVVGIGYQTDAPAGGPGEGRLHRFVFGPLGTFDNGSLVRARVCYAPPTLGETCVASRNAALTVVQGIVAPQVVRQPRGMATLVGETASFDLAVSGTPTPSVRWQLLSADATTWRDIGSAQAWPGTPGNAATLVTPAGTLADDGSVLRAVIANLGGEIVTQPTVWRVTAAPIPTAITLQPVDARTAIGGSAAFAALAEGTAPLSYQWSRDGLPIAGATAPVLTLANVQAADLARYQLVISGPGGSATSRAASLTLATTPDVTAPSIVQQPTPRAVAIGASATFTAAVAGTPPPGCQWTRNGIAIAGATSCTAYMTPPATAGDNGAVFNLVAYNTGGAAFAGGALLTVQGSSTPAGWTVLPSDTGTLLYDIAVVAPRTRLVAIGYDGRIRLSLDAGASWSVQHENADSAKYLTRVKFVDAEVGLALGAGLVLRTADGGSTWREVLSQAIADPLVDGDVQYWQAFDWIDANTAVALSLRRVWISTDRGATWRPHGSFDLGALGVGAVRALRFADALNGFAASDFRLLRTRDGGLTWSDVAAPFTTFTDPLYGIEPGAGGAWIAVGGAGIYRSGDGGTSWSRLAVEGVLGRPGTLGGLKGRGREIVAVGDNGLVLSSNDSGLTWAEQPSLRFGTLTAVDFVEGNGNRPIWVVGNGGVIARLD